MILNNKILIMKFVNILYDTQSTINKVMANSYS